MKDVILTGIKPTGTIHLGNYLGAIVPTLELVKNHDGQSFIFIADYHALTTLRDKKLMAQYSREVACAWLACGLDPKKVVFYRQSDVPEIFELFTIINNVTPKGLMDRAHAFKAAKEDGKEEKVNMGLYNYPILMSADILIANAKYVPVGADQKQHVEIAADIGKAFNALFGNILSIPEPIIKKEVGVIMGLDGRKMSKSYGNIIPLFCPENELLKCIKRITTDSTAPNEPKDRNHMIFQLYKQFAGSDLDNKIGWGDAKQKLFGAINAVISPMREKYNTLMQSGEVEKILSDGSVRARTVARETLSRVKAAVGV